MHHDLIAVSSEQVAALVAEQAPALAGQAVVAVEGAGTVNAIFRVGDSVTARFPLRAADPQQLSRRLHAEAAASAEFVSASVVPGPVPLGIGAPGHGYPLPWAMQSWLPGDTAGPASCETSTPLALDLAELVHSLRRCDTRGRRFTGRGRGGVLSDHDAWVEESIARSAGLLDAGALRALWATFRVLPREDPDVMCHGDLIPSNLLVAGERLTGVLDTGGFQAADPALDLVAGWHLLADTSREHFRRAVGCSELQWRRGAAWAFQQAVGAYWYYRRSNPAMAAMALTTLGRLLSAS